MTITGGGLIPVYPPTTQEGTIDPSTGELIPISDVLGAIRGAPIMRTGQIPNILSTNAVRVIGAEDTRRALILRNLGLVDIYIGSGEQLDIANGWRLAVGDGPLVLESRGEVYAITPSGIGLLGWLAEVDDQ